MKEYKPATFDKRVAYGQRHRKLMLVSRGIIDGFKVRCQSAKRAENLARAFRLRCSKIEESKNARYSLRVKVEHDTIYVTRKSLLRGQRISRPEVASASVMPLGNDEKNEAPRAEMEHRNDAIRGVRRTR